MNCPVCNVELKMMERQGVEIDYCPQCRGVWLDRGELDKIIERSASESGYRGEERHEERRSHSDRDEHYGQPYGKRKKKEGFLSDLFDFD